MMTRRTFLILVPLWVLVSVLAVIWLPDAFPIWAKPVRLVLCAPLALFLPGAMLVDIMRIHGDIMTRTTLAVFLSFAVCIFAGLLLNVTGHLDPEGWVYALGITTISAWCLNILLPLTRPVSVVTWEWPGPRFVIFTVSGVLATGSVLMARPLAVERKPFQFTEFWMVPQSNWTNNVVTIGVRSSEEGDTVYGLEVVLGDTLIGNLPPFKLAPDSSRTFEFSVPTKTRAPERLEAWLYKGGDRGNVYRKVWMTIDTLAPDPDPDINPGPRR